MIRDTNDSIRKNLPDYFRIMRRSLSSDRIWKTCMGSALRLVKISVFPPSIRHFPSVVAGPSVAAMPLMVTVPSARISNPVRPRERGNRNGDDL